jgi:dGTPase
MTSGHSPFGHSGEVVLNRLMKGHGGFEHNRQSLRIVDEIGAEVSRDSPGLNLTWEAREGLMKHADGVCLAAPGRDPEFVVRSPSLEAQVANLADEITYYSHDLDDGLDCGLADSEKALGAGRLRSGAQAASLVRRQARAKCRTRCAGFSPSGPFWMSR